jgi:hypothetical protein
MVGVSAFFFTRNAARVIQSDRQGVEKKVPGFILWPRSVEGEGVALFYQSNSSKL